MAINFKSVGHFFAKAFTAVKNALPAIQSPEKGVEAATAAIPGIGAPAVLVERAAYAVLGEFASVLSAGDAAAKAKLTNAGLDSAVVTQVEELLKTFPTLVTVAKAL